MQQGSTAASDGDLELLRSGIRLIALRALGDPDAADEVAQESMVRALDVIRSSEKTANLGAYVAGIARHVIADRFRANARIVSINQVNSEALRDEAPDVLTALCSEGELAGVRLALEELSEDDRDLLRLCYFDGLTPTEVAGRMGMPPDRIRQRKLRALQRLRIAFDNSEQSGHAGVKAPSISMGSKSAEELGVAK